jgi:hypothetical protein
MIFALACFLCEVNSHRSHNSKAVHRQLYQGSHSAQNSDKVPHEDDINLHMLHVYHRVGSVNALTEFLLAESTWLAGSAHGGTIRARIPGKVPARCSDSRLSGISPDTSNATQTDLGRVMNALQDVSSREMGVWPEVRAFGDPSRNAANIEEWARQFSDESVSKTQFAVPNGFLSRGSGPPADKHPQLGPLLGRDKRQRQRAIFFYDGG